jgi:hypothetical protein
MARESTGCPSVEAREKVHKSATLSPLLFAVMLSRFAAPQVLDCPTGPREMAVHRRNTSGRLCEKSFFTVVFFLKPSIKERSA